MGLRAFFKKNLRVYVYVKASVCKSLSVCVQASVCKNLFV